MKLTQETLHKLNDIKPTLDDYDKEIARRTASSQRMRLFRSFIGSLIVVAAAAVLIATMWLPVMKVNGTSMEPILNDGDLIVAVKDMNIIRHGDIVAFYYNDKVLLKRVIGLPGDIVNIDDMGNVFVNGNAIKEKYIKNNSLGICDVKMPVTVDENSFFVLGDNRAVSVDSRSTDVGNIYYERVVGKIVLRIFPLERLGSFSTD